MPIRPTETMTDSLPLAAETTRAGRAKGRGRGLVRRLRDLYEIVAFYGLLGLFGVSSLIWSLPAALLYRLLPSRLGEPLGQFMIMAGFRYFVGAMRLSGIIKCDLTALDALRHGPALVISDPSPPGHEPPAGEPPTAPTRREPKLGDVFWLGTACALSVVGGGGLGYALDAWLHTTPWLSFAGLAFGIVSAVLVVVAQLRKFS